MFKKMLVLPLLAIFALSLAGCATRGTVKQKDMEIQGLKNQVSLLESQVQGKDQEISGLKDNLSAKEAEQTKLGAEKATKETPTKKVKSRPSVKDIQQALANAGYDPGKADGHMGKQTRDAVKAFQKANNLTANGKVGKKTWVVLGKYLTQKTK